MSYFKPSKAQAPSTSRPPIHSIILTGLLFVALQAIAQTVEPRPVSCRRGDPQTPLLRSEQSANGNRPGLSQASVPESNNNRPVNIMRPSIPLNNLPLNIPVIQHKHVPAINETDILIRNRKINIHTILYYDIQISI